MPSLHTAWPVLAFLFILAAYGRRYLPLILYPAAVSLTIVYTGHHYVIDAVVGALYACAAYYAVERVTAWRTGATAKAAAHARGAGEVEVEEAG